MRHRHIICYLLMTSSISDGPVISIVETGLTMISIVRERLIYGTPRTVQVGQALLADCQLYFLWTDFGPRETLDCPSVGEIATDDLGTLDSYNEWEKRFPKRESWPHKR
jgi:hypothetical protein